MATRRWKNFEDKFIRFSRIHERDGQTDGQTDTVRRHATNNNEVSQTTIAHCEKKLVRLLFDCGVVNTTDDDDYEQQVPSVALCLQQLTTSAVRRRSARLITAAVMWRCVEHESALIVAHRLYYKPAYLPKEASARGSECGYRMSDATFLIVIHIATVGLSCLVVEIWLRDGRRTDDGTTNIAYLVLKTGNNKYKYK